MTFSAVPFPSICCCSCMTFCSRLRILLRAASPSAHLHLACMGTFRCTRVSLSCVNDLPVGTCLTLFQLLKRVTYSCTSSCMHESHQSVSVLNPLNSTAWPFMVQCPIKPPSEMIASKLSFLNLNCIASPWCITPESSSFCNTVDVIE